MNKFVKQLLVVSAVGTAIVVPIAIVTSQGSGPADPAPIFTPVQLANGLAFNQGVAASYLTAFERPQVPLTGKLPTVERSLDASLRAKPALARTFARDAQSGDGTKVRVALGILSNLTRAAFDHVFGQAGGRRMIAWAGQGAKAVDINLAPDAQGTLCMNCYQNSPPPSVTSSPTPTKPWFTCTGPYCLPWPPPTPTPNPSPTLSFPVPPCGICHQNSPPPTVTAPPTGAAQLALSVPPGTAFSLPWFMAGAHRSARVSRQDMAETIAVVAFSLDAD